MTAWYPLLKLVDMSVFSERLKLLREARKITQIRLAELVETDPRVYNRWERGTTVPQFEAIVRIANVLQVSLDELAGRTTLTSEPKIQNKELLDLYHQVDELTDQDQQALVLVIDSFVRKNQVDKIMKKNVKR